MRISKITMHVIIHFCSEVTFSVVLFVAETYARLTLAVYQELSSEKLFSMANY